MLNKRISGRKWEFTRPYADDFPKIQAQEEAQFSVEFKTKRPVIKPNQCLLGTFNGNMLEYQIKTLFGQREIKSPVQVETLNSLENGGYPR